MESIMNITNKIIVLLFTLSMVFAATTQDPNGTTATENTYVYSKVKISHVTPEHGPSEII